MNMNDNTVNGELIYKEGGNTIVANLDSKLSNKVDVVTFTKRAKGWTFQPTFHVKSGDIDLEASADFFEKTNIKVSVLSNGSSSLELNHMLDDKTSIVIQSPKVGGGVDFNNARYELSRSINSVDTVIPKLDMHSKHFSLGWVRKLSAGRALIMNVDPGNYLKVELAGNKNENMRATFTSPWGNIKGADFTFSRTFNL